jgi:hypothetical protein
MIVWKHVVAQTQPDDSTQFYLLACLHVASLYWTHHAAIGTNDKIRRVDAQHGQRTARTSALCIPATLNGHPRLAGPAQPQGHSRQHLNHAITPDYSLILGRQLDVRRMRSVRAFRGFLTRCLRRSSSSNRRVDIRTKQHLGLVGGIPGSKGGSILSECSKSRFVLVAVGACQTATAATGTVFHVFCCNVKTWLWIIHAVAWCDAFWVLPSFSKMSCPTIEECPRVTSVPSSVNCSLRNASSHCCNFPGL